MTAPYGNVHGHIVTADHLKGREQWLKSFAANDLEKRRNPGSCNVVTFSRQESDDRWSTRIGGLPAWKADAPWPNCPACDEQLAFAAQLDFRGTHQRESVPADLLIFHYCFECRPWSPDDNAALVTWPNEVEACELIDEEIIPERLEDEEHGPFYGTHHSVTDYFRWLDGGEEDVDDDASYHMSLSATKIGGHAPGSFGDDAPPDSTGKMLPFLGAINSIFAEDVPKIRDGVRRPACGDLNFADVGCICFWGRFVGKEFELMWGMGSH